MKVAIDTRVETNVVDRIQVFYVGDSEVKDMLSFNELKNIGLQYLCWKKRASRFVFCR